MSGEDGIENEPALFADPITVGVGKFVNQSVCTEHSQLAADNGRTPALLGCIGGGLRVEDLL